MDHYIQNCREKRNPARRKIGSFFTFCTAGTRWNLYSRHKRDTSMLIMNTKLHHNSQNNLAMNKRFLPPLD